MSASDLWLWNLPQRQVPLSEVRCTLRSNALLSSNALKSDQWLTGCFAGQSEKVHLSSRVHLTLGWIWLKKFRFQEAWKKFIWPVCASDLWLWNLPYPPLKKPSQVVPALLPVCVVFEPATQPPKQTAKTAAELNRMCHSLNLGRVFSGAL